MNTGSTKTLRDGQAARSHFTPAWNSRPASAASQSANRRRGSPPRGRSARQASPRVRSSRNRPARARQPHRPSSRFHCSRCLLTNDAERGGLRLRQTEERSLEAVLMRKLRTTPLFLFRERPLRTVCAPPRLSSRRSGAVGARARRSVSCVDWALGVTLKSSPCGIRSPSYWSRPLPAAPAVRAHGHVPRFSISKFQMLCSAFP